MKLLYFFCHDHLPNKFKDLLLLNVDFGIDSITDGIKWCNDEMSWCNLCLAPLNNAEVSFIRDGWMGPDSDGEWTQTDKMEWYHLQ